MSWFDAKGESQPKSVPAVVKKEHAEDWKDFQGDIKDLQAMISAQKERIDGLFLEQKTLARRCVAQASEVHRPPDCRNDWSSADLVRGRHGGDDG